MNNSKGFTLVELAIVLMIIGVILGGVVKGTELVTNAKTKRLYRDYQNVQTAYLAYLDRTGDTPGDITDSQADADRDNKISDNVNFWQELRSENLFDTAGTTDSIPNHVFGGSMTATSGVTATAVMEFTNNNLVCFNSVLDKNADSLDRLFDDDDGTTGEIRHAASATATAATAYSSTDGATGTICISLD